MSFLTRLLFTVVIFANMPAHAQVIKYTRENYKPIRSISPGDTDYSDLEAIGDAIGDAKVVMLGEQDHGDAPTFLAKTRLIKYLHEKKGFNVLSFESDFFALTYGWEQLQKDSREVDSFLLHNVFGIWTLCDACNDLFYNYIPVTQKTAAPLIIAGFDNQIHGRYSKNRLGGFMDSVLSLPKYRDITIPADITAYRKALKTLLACPWTADSTLKGTYKELLMLSNKMLRSPVARDSNDAVVHLLKSIKADVEQMDISYSLGKDILNENGIVRDRAMADNLRWLTFFRYPNEKIIVWAANGHLMKNSPAALRGHHWKYKHLSWWYEAMGTVYCNEFGLDTISYVLAFTSDTGRAGRIGDTSGYAVRPSFKRSFERAFPRELSYSFIDLRQYNKLGRKDKYFFAKGFGHYYREARWNRVFDGFFYIRDMYRCVKTSP